MNEERKTVLTAYGRVDAQSLCELQDTYDTTVLLRMVDELDVIVAGATQVDGLRDMLLRLHGMAHTVINGAGMCVPTENETLPELAFDTTMHIHSIVTTLQTWLQLLEPLERLAPRN